jgi:hypothetical protein
MTSAGVPSWATVDLEGIKADITALALREATNENSAAFNLPSSFIETFTDDTNLGTQTTGDRVGGYWGSITETTTYGQELSRYHTNDVLGTGSWAGSHTNDTYVGETSGGFNAGYTSAHLNWIYDLASDWKIKVFFVADSTGVPTGEAYNLFNALVTTDTSVAAGADTASAGTDGRAFRATDAFSSSIGNGNGFMNTGGTTIHWGDYLFTHAYGQTLGTDNTTYRYDLSQNYAAKTIDCSSGSTPWTCTHGNYWNSNVNYGFEVVYDRNAATITVKMYNNSACTTFFSPHNTTTFTNVPTTGRFFFMPASGGGMRSTNNSWSTSYKDIATADKGYVISGTNSATGTLEQSANTVGSNKTTVGGTLLYKDNAGTASFGSANDLAIYFTCDGGSNWTEATSYNAITPVYSSGIKMVRLGETTCTSGTDIRYRAVFANQASGSKETQLHGIGINY